MAARMIDLGWIQKLDHANMPNVDANLIDFLKSPDWDPKREYSVPWQSGMTGICYNSELTDPVTSFEELLTRPDLKGKVDLLDRDARHHAVPAADAGQRPRRTSPTTSSPRPSSALQGYVDSGQVRRFTGNDYVDDMKSGDIVACEAWSGDVINLLGGGKYKWVPPEEGFAIWTDNMLVPNKAEHKANVETMMNFYYDPVNAAKLSAWNYYFCPVERRPGGDRRSSTSPRSNSEFIFLDDETLETGHQFMSLERRRRRRTYQRQFNEVMSG